MRQQPQIGGITWKISRAKTLSKRAAAELRRRLETNAASLAGTIAQRDADLSVSSTPTITVLMPVYNAERYLAEALDSIVAQGYNSLEIIAIDDGSTDGSSQILAEFSARFPELRVIRQQNSGISVALNTGLAEARGEFIARMDADDVMLPGRLERQAAFLRSNSDIAFCSCYMNFIDHRGRIFGKYRPKPQDVNELVAMVEAGRPITYTHPTIMVRRSLMQATGGYDPRFEPCEDMDLLIKLIAAGQPGVIIPDLLLSYRVHGASISGRRSVQQAKMLDLVMRNLRAVLEGGSASEPETLSTYSVTLPIFTRIGYLSRIRSEAWRQQATYDRAARKPWKARARLLAAILIEPARLPGRIFRRLVGKKTASQSF